MVSQKTIKYINTVSGRHFDAEEIADKALALHEDTRGVLYRLQGLTDELTKLDLHMYISAENAAFQRVGNYHQLRSLYMGVPEVVSQTFLSTATLNTIYDMLLDKEDWKDDTNSLQQLKTYLYTLFSFFFRYRNNHNLLGDPKTSSVIFPTRLLASSGCYIYLQGTITNGCLTETNLINPCMYEELPSLEIKLPELQADLRSISIDTPYKIGHMKSRLSRAGTDKDISEFMMQLKSSLELVRELRKTSPFVVLPGYSMKLNEVNLLIPYFETLKSGLKPQAYIPLRRSEDGAYRPQTIYSLDIARRTVRLFGYTHISGGALT